MKKYWSIAIERMRVKGKVKVKSFANTEKIKFENFNYSLIEFESRAKLI